MRVNMVGTVKKYISIKPSLADDEFSLMWAIWASQLKSKKIDINQLSARDLVFCWKNKQVSSPFNISRSRRKCQEEYPETRGETYYARRKQQDQVKRDLKYETSEHQRQGQTDRRAVEKSATINTVSKSARK